MRTVIPESKAAASAMVVPLIFSGPPSGTTWKHSTRPGPHPYSSGSGRPAGPERLGDGPVVEPVELAADRHAAGERRNGNARAGEAIRQVVGGGLAVDGGGERQDHLGHAVLTDAVDEANDPERLGADAV